MNYFVEGLQGSGKSTLALKLAGKYPGYKAFRFLFPAVQEKLFTGWSESRVCHVIPKGRMAYAKRCILENVDKRS